MPKTLTSSGAKRGFFTRQDFIYNAEHDHYTCPAGAKLTKIHRRVLGAPVEKVLQAMIQAGGGRFHGIRFITASHPAQAAWGSAVIRPEGLMNPNVRVGFARLAALGLSFDAWM